MLGNKIFFVLFVTCWSCLMTVFGVPVPKRPLRNHITGGFKSIENRNSKSDPDCSQFDSDYDVLYSFPFQIMINPINSDWRKSVAFMDPSDTFIEHLSLRNEIVVPLSIFCLKNLERLYIRDMPFPNGIVPDNLENLKRLERLLIINSTIVTMTERLGTLHNLDWLNLEDCSLTYLPNLSGIPRLSFVSFPGNQLSKIDGLTGVYSLDIENNLFTDIPTLNTPDTLEVLYMNNNPVRNMLTVTSYTSLKFLSMSNTTLSFIPPIIDRLEELEELDLSYNKLFYLPTNMLNLANLKYLKIQNNVFSPADIEVLKTRFSTSNPNITLVS